MNLKPYMRKANFYETDQMGIIHHANYIHWFEEARVDFMEQIGFGYDKAANGGIDIALLGISCEYKAMVRFGDTVFIDVTITSLTPTKMTVQYRICDAITGKLCTTGESRHFFYDGVKKRPTSLKKALPELYDLFSEVCVAEQDLEVQ